MTSSPGLLGLCTVLAIAVPRAGLADEAPVDCARFWTFPGGPHSPVAWDQVLSYAACTQDASVFHLERADMAEGFVEQLAAGVDPSIELYVAAVTYGPPHVRLRAAYQVAATYAAMLTRARLSIAAPSAVEDRVLRAELEVLLELPAQLAWQVCAAIDRTVADDPALASDPVTRAAVRAARALANELARGLSIPDDEPIGPPILASP